MTDRDILVELTLELAQGASQPSAADEARNLAALRARLGLPVARAAGASGAQATASNAVREVSSPNVSRHLGRLVGVSALTGVVGFLLGLFMAPELRPELTDAFDAAPSPRVSERAFAGSEAVEVAARAPGADENVVARGSGHAPAAAADDAPSLDEAPSAASAAPPRAARGPAPRARAGLARKAAPADTGPEFLEAVRWLRRAQRAVRRGEGALALGLLEQLDERFPPELLGEERRATRVLGLCGTGEDERARALARELLAQSPRSIYAERLRSSCAAPAVEGEPKKNDLAPRE